MNAKYIFLDIDGTLVDFNGNMPKSAVDALLDAHSRGHHLIISTGRQRSQIYPWLLKSVPFDGRITSAGAMVMHKEEVIYHNCLPKKRVAELLDYFESNQVQYFMQTADALLSKPWCVEKNLELFKKNGYTEQQLIDVFGETTLSDNFQERDDIEKAIYFDAGKSIEAVQKDIGDYYHIVGYSFAKLNNESGEISQKGVNKATGIQKYLEYCHAEIEDTFAFGDSNNDLEMCSAVQTAVAMGNATDRLKSSADYITEDIDEDGLAKAFAHFHLI